MTATSCGPLASGGGEGASGLWAPASAKPRTSTIDRRPRRLIACMTDLRRRTGATCEQYRPASQSSQSRGGRHRAGDVGAEAEAREKPERERDRERRPHHAIAQTVGDIAE